MFLIEYFMENRGWILMNADIHFAFQYGCFVLISLNKYDNFSHNRDMYPFDHSISFLWFALHPLHWGEVLLLNQGKFKLTPSLTKRKYMCNCSQAHSLVYLLFHNHIINKKLTLALTLPRVGCRSGVGVY